MAVNQCVQKDNMSALCDELTPLVESGTLAFPRAVVDDLTTFARDESISFWAQGVSPLLRNFSPQIEHKIWFIRKVQIEMDCDEGLVNADGSEPSLVDVMSLGRRCEQEGTPFYIVSNDVMENPLRPSAAELCAHFGWDRISMAGYLDVHADLSRLLA
jgi:hypothetical protein